MKRIATSLSPQSNTTFLLPSKFTLRQPSGSVNCTVTASPVAGCTRATVCLPASGENVLTNCDTGIALPAAGAGGSTGVTFRGLGESAGGAGVTTGAGAGMTYPGGSGPITTPPAGMCPRTSTMTPGARTWTLGPITSTLTKGTRITTWALAEPAQAARPSRARPANLYMFAMIRLLQSGRCPTPSGEG